MPSLASYTLGCLTLMLWLKLAGLASTVFILVRRRTLKKVRAFFREYWNPAYFHDGVANLAVWSATVGAYGIGYLLVEGQRPVSLERSLEREPLATISILVVGAWLVASTARQSYLQVLKTARICDALALAAFLRRLSLGLILPVALVGWMGGLSLLVTLPSALMPKVWLDHRARHRLRAGVKQFFLDGIAEYALRLVLLAGTAYAEGWLGLS